MIVPLGAANDFARSRDIPQDHATQALPVTWEALMRAIDVECENDRDFFNVATAGFGFTVLRRRWKIMLPSQRRRSRES